MRRELDIKAADGTAKAAIFRPAAGAVKGGVILYMDAFGPRPALNEIAERLAGQGYAVLLPDLFYRKAPYGPFDDEKGTPASADVIRAALAAASR